MEIPQASPLASPSKNAAIEREIASGGGGFAKTILFSPEDSRTNPKPSLIDDIKHHAVAVDPEWDNRPGMNDRLLQFNFYDSQGCQFCWNCLAC